MSSARGSTNRKRPQKHQNRTAFKNDLHDTSYKTKFINSIEIAGVCKRCRDILEWKIKYKKYKPLTAPRKCTECEQKTVKHAYHMLCKPCAKLKKVCPKCCKPLEDESSTDQVNVTDTNDSNADIMLLLKNLPERKRRTVLRHINKQEHQQVTPDIIAQVEAMIKKMDKIDLEDSFFDDELSDSGESEVTS